MRPVFFVFWGVKTGGTSHWGLGPLARKFAQEQIKPIVMQMDEASKLDKSILKGMFENGVSGFFFFYHLS